MNEIPFTLTNRHGDTIVGNVHRAKSPTGILVLCHGFKGFKDWAMFPWIADQAATMGWTSIRFNFSLSGVTDDIDDRADPDLFRRNTFTREREDLDDLLTALHDGRIDGVGRHPIAVLGHSRGGGITILAAAHDERICAIVSWAAVASFERWGPETRRIWEREGFIEVTNSRTNQVLPLGIELLHDMDEHRSDLDILAAAARIHQPWLIVHGEQDLTVPVAEARQLHEAASGRPRLVTLPNCDHSFGSVHPFPGPSPQLIRAMDATIGFLTTLT